MAMLPIPRPRYFSMSIMILVPIGTPSEQSALRINNIGFIVKIMDVIFIQVNKKNRLIARSKYKSYIIGF